MNIVLIDSNFTSNTMWKIIHPKANGDDLTPISPLYTPLLTMGMANAQRMSSATHSGALFYYSNNHLACILLR